MDSYVFLAKTAEHFWGNRGEMRCQEMSGRAPAYTAIFSAIA
jgi:hypothetical protein